MPGSQREVQNAEEEGVEFVWMSPRLIRGHVTGEAMLAQEIDVDGDPVAVASVRVQKMRLGAPDVSGRRSPELIEAPITTNPPIWSSRRWGSSPRTAPPLGRRGAGGHPLGHHQGRLPDPFDQPARRLCRGRHRAWRVAGGLGDPRRARAADSIANWLADAARVAAANRGITMHKAYTEPVPTDQPARLPPAAHGSPADAFRPAGPGREFHPARAGWKSPSRTAAAPSRSITAAAAMRRATRRDHFTPDGPVYQSRIDQRETRWMEAPIWSTA